MSPACFDCGIDEDLIWAAVDGPDGIDSWVRICPECLEEADVLAEVPPLKQRH